MTLRAVLRKAKGVAAPRLSSSLTGGLARAVLRARSLPGHSDYERFIVLGIARTGSTLLVELLNAHSQVMAFGELFRSPEAIGWDVPPFINYQSPSLTALHRSDPVGFLEKGVFRQWPRRIGAVGFKIFYYHARQSPQSLVWDYLARDRGIRVLHLRRRNVLEQYLSLQVANMTNSWSTTSHPVQEPPPIRLEAEACRKHFAWVRGLEAEAAGFFRDHAVQNVYYEELLADRQGQMRQVQDFLGLRNETVEATLARQRTRPLSHSIANYEELREAFARTCWEEFFCDRVVKA